MTSATKLGRLAAALIITPLLLGSMPPASLEEALAAQRELVERQPGSAGALNDLGNLLAEAGDVEAAEDAYRRAIQAAPERAAPRFNLALLLQESGRRRAALRELKLLLRDHPSHAWGHYQLGTIHAARGNRRSALRSYSRAFQLDPRLTQTRFNPHIVDNPMTTSAMLRAFSRISPAASAPRAYADPSHITGLLLPRLSAQPAADEPAADEPAAAEQDDDG